MKKIIILLAFFILSTLTFSDSLEDFQNREQYYINLMDKATDNMSYNSATYEYLAFMNGELTLAYKNILKNKSVKVTAAFKSSQLKWVEFKNREVICICEFYSEAYGNGSGLDAKLTLAEAKLVKERIESLLIYDIF